MSDAFLSIRDVRKQYGPLTALGGVSFDVYAGEVFGLLGPNGAGKSTLMGILSCLLPATAGTVTLDGRDVTSVDREIRRLIGVVPQELALYEQLTASENLYFFGELFGMSGADLRQQVSSLLDAVGLTSRAHDRCGHFSGGMKRRLNLACALVHRPRLLLLDEPTVGVDPQSRNLIFEEVRRLNAAGLTVIYTSHYMEEVEALCHRIGILDHGALLACDTRDGLVRRMKGMIRFRVSGDLEGVRKRLDAFAPGAWRLAEGWYEVDSAEVKSAVVEVIRLLNVASAELLALETVEPNLERVFLHLTGRALRD